MYLREMITQTPKKHKNKGKLLIICLNSENVVINWKLMKYFIVLSNRGLSSHFQD